MSVMEAIYKRRSVRSYKPQQVGLDTIHALLSAAVQAPNAMREEPWVFTIVQDKTLLKGLSDEAKKSFSSDARKILPKNFGERDFNIFYDAGTLAVIYGREGDRFVAADCWLAAENLMLAACAMGLGSCVIGLAVDALNSPGWKERLGIAEDLTAYVPVVLGVPHGDVLPVPRKKPEIISWKK